MSKTHKSVGISFQSKKSSRTCRTDEIVVIVFICAQVNCCPTDRPVNLPCRKCKRQEGERQRKEFRRKSKEKDQMEE